MMPKIMYRLISLSECIRTLCLILKTICCKKVDYFSQMFRLFNRKCACYFQQNKQVRESFLIAFAKLFLPMYLADPWKLLSTTCVAKVEVLDPLHLDSQIFFKLFQNWGNADIFFKLFRKQN